MKKTTKALKKAALKLKVSTLTKKVTALEVAWRRSLALARTASTASTAENNKDAAMNEKSSAWSAFEALGAGKAELEAAKNAVITEDL